MHLMITKYIYKGKLYKHAKIVESYLNENNESRKRVLRNIGPIKTEEDLRRAEALLEKMKTGEKVVSLDEIIYDKIKEYGIIYACEKLWKKFGMDKIIEELFSERKTEFSMFDAVFLSTVSRLYGLRSDLETYEWIKEKAHYPTFIRLHHLYRSLNLLVDEKDRFERLLLKRLRKKRRLKVDIVFYDLTSTYFEGKGPPIAEFGYNRDKKRGKKQIVIGLVLCDGYPITHRIWPGNTLDKTTLKQAVSDLKKKFRMRKIIFVADRGIFIETNLKELEDKEYEYIIATNRRKDDSNMDFSIKDLITMDTDEGARVVKRDGKRRYILCFDKETQKDEKEYLMQTRKEAERKLEKLKKELKGKKKSKSALNNRVKKELKKSERKFFEWNLSKGKFTYSLKKNVWDYENAIAGKFLLITTSKLSPKKVMESYKDLKYIEQTFRELKDIINLRPINHRLVITIGGHVFICVLSIFTRRLMSKSLRETNEIVKQLREIKAIEATIDGEKYYFSTTPNKEQKMILKKLGIEEPMKYL